VDIPVTRLVFNFLAHFFCVADLFSRHFSHIYLCVV
jgi:hypothetical protein